MTLIALEDAGPRLSQLIENARDGEEIILTRDSAPVAKIVPLGQDTPPRRLAGSAKDVITFLADDFDAPLEDFKEYM